MRNKCVMIYDLAIYDLLFFLIYDLTIYDLTISETRDVDSSYRKGQKKSHSTSERLFFYSLATTNYLTWMTNFLETDQKVL